MDDGIPTHPKFLKAGPVASWLWICGLCYCNRHLTDGFIPAESLPMIGHIPAVQAHVKQLVAVGLWEVVDGGYQVHDFHDHNETRSDALARQEVIRTQRQRAGVASGLSRRKQERQSERAVNAPVEQTPNGPVHSPFNGSVASPLNPIPSHPIPSDPHQAYPGQYHPEEGLITQEQARSPLSSARDADFEQFRAAYPASRRVGGKNAKRAFLTATAGKNGTHFAAMISALEQHKRSEQWQNPSLIPLMTTWLNQERWNQTLPEHPGGKLSTRTQQIAKASREFLKS